MVFTAWLSTMHLHPLYTDHKLIYVPTTSDPIATVQSHFRKMSRDISKSNLSSYLHILIDQPSSLLDVATE